MSQKPTVDWRNSPAHIELLSKFVKPDSMYSIPESYRNSEWREVLGEPALTVIQRFIAEGYLIRPDLVTLMNYKLTVTDLKSFCKERGLPVSGKKAELIERLITADEPGMQKTVSDLQVFVCSEKGNMLARAYLEMRSREKEEAISLFLENLKKKDFLQAVKTVNKYEARQVFQRGIGINWREEALAPNPHYVSVLKILFEETPTVARRLDPKKLEFLRVVAGFMCLWGSQVDAIHLLEGVEEVSEKFKNIDLARLLWSFASNTQELREYRELARATGGKGYKVEILTANDEYVCDECKKLAKKKYPVFGDVPELPSPKCAHACRCGYALDVGY